MFEKSSAAGENERSVRASREAGSASLRAARPRRSLRGTSRPANRRVRPRTRPRRPRPAPSRVVARPRHLAPVRRATRIGRGSESFRLARVTGPRVPAGRHAPERAHRALPETVRHVRRGRRRGATPPRRERTRERARARVPLASISAPTRRRAFRRRENSSSFRRRSLFSRDEPRASSRGDRGLQTD